MATRDEAFPEVALLAVRCDLERAGTGAAIPVTEADKAKADAIRAAQCAGTVSDRFDTERILAMVLNPASSCPSRSPAAVGLIPPRHRRRGRPASRRALT